MYQQKSKCYTHVLRVKGNSNMTPTLGWKLKSTCPLAGPHQVIVRRDPFDGVMENVAVGLVAGMVAGTAIRSFLWMPFFFC